MLKGKLPSEVVNERHQYVNGLKQFVEEQKKNLKQVLQQLGLTEESLAKVEPKQLCPYNPDHYVPEKSFKTHVEKCRLLKAGYQNDELPTQVANRDFCYEGKNSMKIEIDESLMNKIIWDDCVQTGEVYTGHRTVPGSHMEENTNLTQNDRLAIYRYVVDTSHQAGKVIPVDKTDELLTTDWGSLVKKGLLDAQNNEKYSSKLEQLAALRDMKRRRQSYRAKNVHITKKSYTEIIREVIVNQMEVLVPVDSKTPAVENEDTEKYKSISIANDSRQRRERDRDGDDKGSSSSYSRRHRSRSRDRDRRRHKHHNDEHDQDDRRKDDIERDREEGRSRSRHQKISDENYESVVDLKLVKNEAPPTSIETAASGYRTELLDREMSNRGKERNEGINSNSRSSSLSRRSKRSRSSSPSSSEDQRRHHSHKKSKHKKKSKHSKKHSKKHKR